VKGDRRAAATRLLGVANRYPLYSKSDRVLWMMGDIFEKSEKKDFAGSYYARIVRDYPLSPLVGDAKGKLKAFGQPIPQADPNAVAWMTAEANTPRQKPSRVRKPLELFNSGPQNEKMTAATHGTPQMAPQSDATSFGELLKPGGGVTGSGGKGPALIASVPAGGSTATAETVGTSDAAGNSTGDNGAAPATADPAAGAQPGGATATPAAGTAPTGNAIEPSSVSAAAPPANAAAPAAESATPAPEKTDAAVKSDASAAGGDAKADTATTPASDAAKSGDAQSSGDAKKESSSKKKKGLRKLVPW
jgi:hypothetical protein